MWLQTLYWTEVRFCLSPVFKAMNRKKQNVRTAFEGNGVRVKPVVTLQGADNSPQHKTKNKQNLAKLDDGLAKSPTVMVEEKKKRKKNWEKIGAY